MEDGEKKDVPFLRLSKELMSNLYLFTEYELNRFIVGSIAFVAHLLSLPSAIYSPVLPEIGVTLVFGVNVSICIACEVDLYKIQGYYECTFVYK